MGSFTSGMWTQLPHANSHVGSSSRTRNGTWAPDWEHEIFASGLPGKSQGWGLLESFFTYMVVPQLEDSKGPTGAQTSLCVCLFLPLLFGVSPKSEFALVRLLPRHMLILRIPREGRQKLHDRFRSWLERHAVSLYCILSIQIVTKSCPSLKRRAIPSKYGWELCEGIHSCVLKTQWSLYIQS